MPCLCGAPFLFAVEAELDDKDGEREEEADGVGEDDGRGVDSDSVEQPEKDTAGVDGKHSE